MPLLDIVHLTETLLDYILYTMALKMRKFVGTLEDISVTEFLDEATYKLLKHCDWTGSSVFPNSVRVLIIDAYELK
jgi:hypothetical protein